MGIRGGLWHPGAQRRIDSQTRRAHPRARVQPARLALCLYLFCVSCSSSFRETTRWRSEAQPQCGLDDVATLSHCSPAP